MPHINASDRLESQPPRSATMSNGKTVQVLADTRPSISYKHPPHLLITQTPPTHNQIYRLVLQKKKDPTRTLHQHPHTISPIPNHIFPQTIHISPYVEHSTITYSDVIIREKKMKKISLK